MIMMIDLHYTWTNSSTGQGLVLDSFQMVCCRLDLGYQMIEFLVKILEVTREMI